MSPRQIFINDKMGSMANYTPEQKRSEPMIRVLDMHPEKHYSEYE
jgi:hypothetical protein